RRAGLRAVLRCPRMRGLTRDGGPGRRLFGRRSPAGLICLMCRVLAYLGPPRNVEPVLFATDSSLVRQAYSPRMMASFLNLAGFGMVAWDPESRMPEAPFVYRVTTLPVF